jgi:tight adherence protein C
MNYVFLAIAIGAAVFSTTVLLLLSAGDRSATEARLMEISAIVASGNLKYQPRSLMERLTEPLVPLRKWMKSFDESLAFRLSLGGFRKPEHADTFVNAKLVGLVLGIIGATFTRSNFVIVALFCGALGFFAPDLYLIRQTARRKSKMSEALPDLIDLLIICIDAGLGMDQAVLKVADEMKPVCPELSEELQMIGREQRAGKPRTDAWRTMAERNDLDIVRQFVGMLTQSEKFGTPIARSLLVFSESLRTKRLLKAEELAAKTTVKLIFPLVLCIFPAMFIVLLGPAILSIRKVFGQ